MQWYLKALRAYAQFNGRARRSEYWWFTLVHIIISSVLYAVMIIPLAMTSLAAEGGAPEPPSPLWMAFGLVFLVYTLATLIPTFAVQARRLHDIGRSGWWMLIGFIPLAGLVILVFNFLDSQPGPNVYGPNPKGM